MTFDGINWLAVLVAAVSAFLLGALWYGPLFKNASCRENGIDPAAPPQRHPCLPRSRASCAIRANATLTRGV